MSPEYQILTQRLCLRLVDSEDIEQLTRAITRSRSLHEWVDWCHPGFNIEEAQRFILATRLNWVKGDAFGFGIYRRLDSTLLGMVAINELYSTFNMASLGYWIADDYQRLGYGKEALDALIEFCFAQLKLTRLEVVCDPNNLPSQSLAIRCGAEFEVIARNRYLYDGKPYPGMVFAITP
ncbi:GNAT family N-acetyltransferase [Vibrio sp.]|uniref:GNAT family N-acetyltransferase n=1 Tax=Vibrio sp. TaxID=678 RepID=UPI003D10DE76